MAPDLDAAAQFLATHGRVLDRRRPAGRRRVDVQLAGVVAGAVGWLEAHAPAEG